jgi:hypothetical protein
MHYLPEKEIVKKTIHQRRSSSFDSTTIRYRSTMNSLNGSYTSASGEGRSRERAVQVSEANTSLSSVSSMPRALYSSVNAELLRMMLSSGHIAPRAIPNSALRADMMDIDGSQRNELASNIISQLSGNNSSTTQLQTTAQLSAEALCIAALMRSERSPLPPARTTQSIEQQLRLLIQEQQAQQTLEVAASNIAASRNAPYHLAGPRMAQSLPLEYFQLLTQQQQYQHQQYQHHRHQPTLVDALLQAQAAPRAGNYSFSNQAHDRPTATPSSTVSTATTIAIPPPFGRYGKVELFPGKLYRLLAEAERDGNTHIVSFTPDGRAFKINDPNAFIKDVSPKYFRQSLLSSFVRQLNFYGFDRLSHGPDLGAFAHPCFIRGRPELLDRIERQNITPRAKKS